MRNHGKDTKVRKMYLTIGNNCDIRANPKSSLQSECHHYVLTVTMAVSPCRILLIRCSPTPHNRFLTTSTRPGERLRIAIVGGGAAGLSSALSLAPLVEKGRQASPIDVFEPGNNKGREIGVGLWSTALEPFRTSQRSSHQMLWEDMTHCGTWVGDVGYRTPNGRWLARRAGPHKSMITWKCRDYCF